MKIRADLAHGDYRDPGWYRAPAGSVAYAAQGEPLPTLRGDAPPASEGAIYKVRKPGSMQH
jgi:manganese oxidase